MESGMIATRATAAIVSDRRFGGCVEPHARTPGLVLLVLASSAFDDADPGDDCNATVAFVGVGVGVGVLASCGKGVMPSGTTGALTVGAGVTASGGGIGVKSVG